MKFRITTSASKTGAINAVISYDELRMSKVNQKDIHRPKPMQIILDDIHRVLGENEIAFEQEDIFVERSTAINEAKEKSNIELAFNHKRTGSFANWSFDNLYTKIVITDDLNEFEGALIVAYNPSGMQLAFGLTYEGRTKFAHFGEDDTVISTVACGEFKVLAYFVMMHKVKQWFPFDNQYIIEQLEKTSLLMNKAISSEFAVQFVENFNQYTKKYSDCLEDATLLEEEEFDRFIELLRKEVEQQFAGVKKLSAWDLFSAGNAIIRPDAEFNLKTLIPLNYTWGGYVFSRLT